MLAFELTSFSIDPQRSETTNLSNSIVLEKVTSQVTVETPVLEKQDDWYDLDKLAHAVCMQETHCGKDGVGKTKNNVCGIVRNGSFESYNSVEEGLEDCKSVLLKYKPWTIDKISKRWTTTQISEWATNVNYYYGK